jgi:phospholipase C
MCPWNKSEANPADAHGSFHPYSLQEFGCGYKHAGWGGSLNMFSGEQLPVKKAVADNFGVFNNYYTSVPGFSVPNHLFAQSGEETPQQQQEQQEGDAHGGAPATLSCVLLSHQARPAARARTSAATEAVAARPTPGP